MTLSTTEFIRRFLLHILPPKFVKIRHYGLLANHQRKENVTRARTLLNSFPEMKEEAASQIPPSNSEGDAPSLPVCPHCGKAALVLIQTFHRGEIHPKVFILNSS